MVTAFFTWTHDKLVAGSGLPWDCCKYFTVYDLFKFLFCGPSLKQLLESKPSLNPPSDTPHPFQQVFRNVRMHFNHFIKPYKQAAFSCQCLIRFLACGAVALGANYQPGFDAVYLYLYESLNLDKENLAFISV